MDDTDKTQGQPGQVQNQQPQGGGSVGSLVKEHGPTATGQTGVSELVKPSGSETEPKIHRELEEIGVRSVSEFPTVGHEERKVGIEPAGESVPVKPSGIVHPSIMTEEEARQTLKNAKPSESVWGLAAVILKFFKSIHHKLLTSKG